jgi:hypothetical protein
MPFPIIGKMYEARKKSHGASDGFRGNQSVSAQFGHQQKAGRTVDAIAQEVGVGKETVKRYEKFSKGIDALRDSCPEAAEKVLNGVSGASKGEIAELSKKELPCALLWPWEPLERRLPQK